MEEKKNNNSIGIIIVLVVVIFILLGYIIYDKCFSNNEPKNTNPTNTVVNNQTEETTTNNNTVINTDENQTVENNTIIEKKNSIVKFKNKQIESIEYNAVFKESDIYKDASSIKEGEKYETLDGYITLEKGVPYFVTNGKKIDLNYKNIKEAYFMGAGEYTMFCALLTNDGLLYVLETENHFYFEWGRFDGSTDGIDSKTIILKEFKKFEKVESNNKYSELKSLDLGWASDDTRRIGLIAITEDGLQDLIRFN